MVALTTLNPFQNPQTAAVRVEIAAFVRDGESRAFLTDYLREASVGAVEIAAGGVVEAVRFLERAPQPPRVLLVDLSGVDTPLSAIDALADACEPSIIVVALGDKDNVFLFRELIRAGIADYVTKPLSPDLLDPYARRGAARIAADGAPARRGKVVAFAGARGGVGVTTLAVGTAWRLAEVQKRRVALVDLDMHGGAACVQLGLEPGGLADTLANHRRLDSLFLERTMIRRGERLSVLAEDRPIDADAPIDPAALDAVLDALAEEFHYVLLDLPRRFGPLHAHVFSHARLRVVVADRTVPSMRDGARLLEAARASREPTLLTLNDHRHGMARLMPDDLVTSALGRAPDVTIDFDRGATKAADNLGEPAAAGSGPVAKGAAALIKAMAGRRAAPTGALQRLTRWLRR
jgi:pilus assembly protein CpaE